jgi:YbgC/YbaW family acyl-CoA thioester hydrolase
MAFDYHGQYRVTFAETDMAGIVHFSNFFRYMENAEHEFFRQLGLSIHMPIEGRIFSWPRVRAECDYHSPLRFEDELDIHLWVHQKTRKCITYKFAFSVAHRAIAEGSLTVVCVVIDPQTRQMTSTTIPDLIGAKIDVAPPGYAAPGGAARRIPSKET